MAQSKGPGRLNQSQAQLPCPGCGYELAQTPGTRCPECGAAFDRAALLERLPPRVPGGVLLVMLAFMFGTPALAGMTSNGRRLVAVVSTVVWTVQADRLLWFLPTQPAASVEFIRHLAGKLQTACDDAADLVFDDCNRRLLKTLVRFSSSAAAETQDDSVVLRITHEQLAQAVGVARETVSLALTQLRQQNLLRTGRNQLVFNPNVLKTFITKSPAAATNGAATPVVNEG